MQRCKQCSCHSTKSLSDFVRKEKEKEKKGKRNISLNSETKQYFFKVQVMQLLLHKTEEPNQEQMQLKNLPV